MSFQSEKTRKALQLLGAIALALWVISSIWEIEYLQSSISLELCQGICSITWTDFGYTPHTEIRRADYTDQSLRDVLGLELPRLYGIDAPFGGLDIPLWPWPLLAIATSQWFQRRPIYQRLHRGVVHIVHHRGFRFGRRLVGGLFLIVAFLSVFTFAGVAYGWGACVQQGTLDFTWWYESLEPPAAWIKWTGFDFKWHWPQFNYQPEDVVIATVPTWLLLPIGILLLAYRSHPKTTEPTCKECGYILTGNQSGTCSECGRRIPGPNANATTARESLH